MQMIELLKDFRESLKAAPAAPIAARGVTADEVAALVQRREEARRWQASSSSRPRRLSRTRIWILTAISESSVALWIPTP